MRGWRRGDCSHCRSVGGSTICGTRTVAGKSQKSSSTTNSCKPKWSLSTCLPSSSRPIRLGPVPLSISTYSGPNQNEGGLFELYNAKPCQNRRFVRGKISTRTRQSSSTIENSPSSRFTHLLRNHWPSRLLLALCRRRGVGQILGQSGVVRLCLTGDMPLHSIPRGIVGLAPRA